MHLSTKARPGEFIISKIHNKQAEKQSIFHCEILFMTKDPR